MSTLILTGISISILRGLVAEMASNTGLIKVYNDLNRNYPETQYNFAHPIHIQSRLLVSFFFILIHCCQGRESVALTLRLWRAILEWKH